MTKQSILKSSEKPSVVARILSVLDRSKPTGEYTIETPNNGYWVRLNYGTVVDAAPVIRENNYLRTNYKFLLAAIKKREGSYELFSLTR